jgi:hypothetical protein
MLRKTIFTIGDESKAYIGYTSGRLWNGWATPFFEKAEANKVAEGFNECAEFPMQYDEVYDQFYILDTETEELEKWEGIDYPTTEGIKHLYGIGAYCWIWDEVNEQDIDFLAEAIEDFIYEYDTYEARDLYEFREEMIETIKTQLKELTIFQKVYEIWHNDDLTEEFKYEVLGEVLSV